ncbi:MAG: Rv3235 family protein [Micropruina sp.]|uniref:Rv3235 family protein n=1 Tax=Micropruina sp. TaxID=2737536 RepID=UPI0039E3DC1B
MPSSTDVLIRAPVVLAPAVRLVQPALIEPPQQPLLPWPEPEPPPAVESPGIPDQVRHQVGALVAALVEVLRGRRPPPHLEPHAGTAVLELIGRLRGEGALPTMRLRSLRLDQPAPDVVEVAAHLRLGERSRAAALRAERRPGDRWRLTELELALDAVVLRSSR